MTALSDSRPLYRPRGPNPLRRLFRLRFPAFKAAYEQRYAATFGRFRRKLFGWEEQQDTVSWKSSPSEYFKGRQRSFALLDFIAQVTLHVPPRGRYLMRRYGLYSSRRRGTWKGRPAHSSCAPDNWYGRKAVGAPAPSDASKDQEVSAFSRRKARVRLLAKVNELDVMARPRCGQFPDRRQSRSLD